MFVHFGHGLQWCTIKLIINRHSLKWTLKYRTVWLIPEPPSLTIGFIEEGDPSSPLKKKQRKKKKSTIINVFSITDKCLLLRCRCIIHTFGFICRIRFDSDFRMWPAVSCLTDAVKACRVLLCKLLWFASVFQSFYNGYDEYREGSLCCEPFY